VPSLIRIEMSIEQLDAALAKPSAECWQTVIEIGRFKLNKQPGELLALQSIYQNRVAEAVKSWPPEIERVCPAGWPKVFREAVEHRVRETDTYGHYVAAICGHPDLRLSDGSQAVWLERRFTGGVVQVSTAQQALRLLSAAQAASSIPKQTRLLEQCRHLLANGVRNVGRVGAADLTGGLTIEREVPHVDWPSGKVTPTRTERHEYRLEVEVKIAKPQSEEQCARMESVRRRGGCYVLCHSIAEAVEQIKTFAESKR